MFMTLVLSFQMAPSAPNSQYQSPRFRSISFMDSSSIKFSASARPCLPCEIVCHHQAILLLIPLRNSKPNQSQSQSLALTLHHYPSSSSSPPSSPSLLLFFFPLPVPFPPFPPVPLLFLLLPPSSSPSSLSLFSFNLCTKSFKMLSSPSFLLANNITSSVLMVLRWAWWAKDSRSEDVFSVKRRKKELARQGGGREGWWLTQGRRKKGEVRGRGRWRGAGLVERTDLCPNQFSQTSNKLRCGVYA